MAKKRKDTSLFSCTDSKILTLAEEILAGSGIPLDFAAANKVDILSPEQAAPLFKGIGKPPGNAAILFTYHSISPSGILTPVPIEKFSRIRPIVVQTGFEAQAPGSKYLQRGYGSMLYILTHNADLEEIDWPKFLKDTTERLGITEGEKKTLAGVCRGLFVVGVGGKDSVYESRNDKTLVDGLVTLAKKRRSYTMFDIDKGYTAYKPDVRQSVERLALDLSSSGSKVSVTLLPSSKEDKTGLDDWLLTVPNVSGEELWVEIERGSTPHKTAKELFPELHDWVYIEHMRGLGNTITRELLPSANYLESRSKTPVTVNCIKLAKDEILGGMVEKLVQERITLGKAFMESPARPTVFKADLFPGDSRAIIVELNRFNLWPGFAQKEPEEPATKEDVAVFFEFLEGFHGSDAKFMADWYLWPIKHPGAKLFTIPVIKCPQEGAGKSTISELIGEYVYGPEFWTIVGADKLNKNAFKIELVGGKLFTVIGDADDVEVSATMSAIKGITTQKFITVVYKYMNKCTIRNYNNTIVDTNRERPFSLTKFDRRFAMPECTTKYWDREGKKIHEIFIRLHKFFEEGGGGKLISYAKHSHDFGEFDPRVPAPMTFRKIEQIGMSQSPIQEAVKKLVHAEVYYGRDLYTFTELKLAAEQILIGLGHPGYKFNYPQLVAALREEGVVSIGVVPTQGTTYSVYALKNSEEWKLRTVGEIEEELLKDILQKEDSEEDRKKKEKRSADIIKLADMASGRLKSKFEK